MTKEDKKSFLIDSVKLGSQPLLWKQAVVSSDNRGWNAINVLLYPLKKFLYQKKENPSLLADVFIAGTNPIIDALLLLHIARHCLENELHQKVVLFMPDQVDYWAYEMVQEPEFFKMIHKKTGIQTNSIEGFFEEVMSSMSTKHLEVILLKTDELAINYCKYDEQVDGWIFHLFDKPAHPSQPQQPLTPYIELQNEIKNKLQQEFIYALNRHRLLHGVKWHERSAQNTPIVLSRKVFLSSLPQGWFNMQSKVEQDMVNFEHGLLACSYGSAVNIPVKPEKFPEHVLACLQKLSYGQIEPLLA